MDPPGGWELSPICGLDGPWAESPADVLGLGPDRANPEEQNLVGGVLLAQEGSGHSYLTSELARKPCPNLGYLVPAPPQPLPPLG